MQMTQSPCRLSISSELGRHVTDVMDWRMGRQSWRGTHLLPEPSEGKQEPASTYI